MAVRLEPVFLANVLLYIDNDKTIEAFPSVSKGCREAALTLKVNPAAFCEFSWEILWRFPNINTMVVDNLSCFDFDELPDTVTAVIVENVDFADLTEERLRYADRVVEIRRSVAIRTSRADFSLFPRLERLRLDGVPDTFTLPAHTLKRLTVFCERETTNPLALFPPECAEQLVFIFPSQWPFLEAKSTHPPPNVRVLCNQLGEGVAPEDLATWPPSRASISLTYGFGVDELRAFNDALPLPFREVGLQCEDLSASGNSDISFLTAVTELSVDDLEYCALALPTSVARLVLSSDVSGVSFSGTENLTHLDVRHRSVTTTPCPRLRQLWWTGETLAAKTLPCPVGDMPALVEMTASVRAAVDPDFRFPTQLTALELNVPHDSVDAAQLTPLTRLQRLDVRVGKGTLDLSGMTALTSLNAGRSLVTRLPASLVECRVALHSDTDLSPLTGLTSLGVLLDPGIRVTFPTGLKRLCVDEGRLGESNIGDVALESFRSTWGRLITWDDLERLPKTLRWIEGQFESESLKEQLRAVFPLLWSFRSF